MAPIAKDNEPGSSEIGSECSEETVIIPRFRAGQQPVVDLNDPQNYGADRPVRTTRNMNPVYRDIPPQMEFKKVTSITKTKKKGPGLDPKPKELTPRRQNIISNFLKEIVAQAGKQGFVRVQWRAELMRRLQTPSGRGGTAIAPITNLDLSNWLKDKKFAEILKKLEQGSASTFAAAHQNEDDTSADNQPGPSVRRSLFRPAPAPDGNSSNKRKAPLLGGSHYKQMALRLPIQPDVVIEPLDLTIYKSKGKNGVTLCGPAPANLTNRQEEGRAPGPVIPLQDIQDEPAGGIVVGQQQNQVEPEDLRQGLSGGVQQQQEERGAIDNLEGIVVVAGSSSPSNFASASGFNSAVAPAPVLEQLRRPKIIRSPLLRASPAPQQQEEDMEAVDNQEVQQNEGVVVVARSSGSSPPLRFESTSASPVAPGPVAVPTPLGRCAIVCNALFQDPPAPVVQNEDQYIAAMIQVRQLRYHVSQMVSICNGFNDQGYYPEGMNGQLIHHLLNAVVATVYDRRLV